MIKHEKEEIKNEEKLFKQYTKDLETKQKKKQALEGKYKKLYSEGKSVVKDLNKNIDLVVKGAKALGLDINVSQYRNIAQKLEGELVEI